MRDSLLVAKHIGEEEYNHAVQISEALFKGNIKDLSLSDIEACFKGLKQEETNEDINIVDALVLVKAAQSKREARDFVNNGATLINAGCPE